MATSTGVCVCVPRPGELVSCCSTEQITQLNHVQLMLQTGSRHQQKLTPLPLHPINPITHTATHTHTGHRRAQDTPSSQVTQVCTRRWKDVTKAT